MYVMEDDNRSPKRPAGKKRPATLPLDKPLYNVQEAAAVLRISRSLLYKQAQLGNVVLDKIGARTVITRANLQALLDLGHKQ
jgi:hypothetical protein